MLKGKRLSAIISISLALLVTTKAAHAQQIDQAVDVLAGQIMDSLQAEGKATVAVVEFTDLSGQVTPLGRLVAEELVSRLFSQGNGRLKLVERSKLEQVLGEQRLGVQGLLEKRNIETFGRLLGVEAVLTGTLAVLDDRVRINARLIAVPSAELFATAATYMSRLGLPPEYFKAEHGSKVGGGNTKSATSSGPVGRQTFQGITYELLGCSRATQLITCDVVIINHGADRWHGLRLWDYTGASYPTGMYDQRGHYFDISWIKYADVAIDRQEASQNSKKNLLYKYILTDLPTQSQLYFEGIPDATEFIKVLRLSTSDGIIEFRDVPLSN